MSTYPDNRTPDRDSQNQWLDDLEIDRTMRNEREKYFREHKGLPLEPGEAPVPQPGNRLAEAPSDTMNDGTLYVDIWPKQSTMPYAGPGQSGYNATEYNSQVGFSQWAPTEEQLKEEQAAKKESSKVSKEDEDFVTSKQKAAKKFLTEDTSFIEMAKGFWKNMNKFVETGDERAAFALAADIASGGFARGMVSKEAAGSLGSAGGGPFKVIEGGIAKIEKLQDQIATSSTELLRKAEKGPLTREETKAHRDAVVELKATVEALRKEQDSLLPPLKDMTKADLDRAGMTMEQYRQMLIADIDRETGPKLKAIEGGLQDTVSPQQQSRMISSRPLSDLEKRTNDAHAEYSRQAPGPLKDEKAKLFHTLRRLEKTQELAALDKETAAALGTKIDETLDRSVAFLQEDALKTEQKIRQMSLNNKSFENQVVSQQPQAGVGKDLDPLAQKWINVLAKEGETPASIAEAINKSYIIPGRTITEKEIRSFIGANKLDINPRTIINQKMQEDIRKFDQEILGQRPSTKEIRDMLARKYPEANFEQPQVDFVVKTLRELKGVKADKMQSRRINEDTGAPKAASPKWYDNPDQIAMDFADRRPAGWYPQGEAKILNTPFVIVNRKTGAAVGSALNEAAARKTITKKTGEGRARYRYESTLDYLERRWRESKQQ